MEKLETLCAELCLHCIDARDVGAGSRQIVDEAILNCVRKGDKDNGDRRRRRLGTPRHLRSRGENDGDPVAHKLRRGFGHSLGIVIGPAIFKAYITPVDETGVAHSLQERLDAVAVRVRGSGQETTDNGQAPLLSPE
jgi:hypothetical protein